MLNSASNCKLFKGFKSNYGLHEKPSVHSKMQMAEIYFQYHGNVCEIPSEKFKCLCTLLLFFFDFAYIIVIWSLKSPLNDTFNWYASLSLPTQVGLFNHKSTSNIKYLGTEGEVILMIGKKKRQPDDKLQKPTRDTEELTKV